MSTKTLAALCAGLCITPAQAGDPIPTLDQIVVTATRLADETGTHLAAASVLTREDLERRQARSLQDALAGMAGIGIANSGGMGMPTSVFLRGANAGHTLVLLDGVRLGSATLGTVAFQDLPLAWIERIEVVRGPLSSLYGSEAVGGVIQLFTRPDKEVRGLSVSLGAGSRDTHQASASLAAAGEHAWLKLGLARQETDGFNSCKGSLAAGCFTIEPDRDGYRNDSLLLRGGYRFSPDFDVDATFLRAQGRVEYDGAFQNEAENTQQVVGLGLRYRPAPTWTTRLQLGQSRDLSEQSLNGAATGFIDTTRTRYGWQNEFSLGARQTLTLGIEREEDEVASSTPYATRRRVVDGAYVQYLGRLGEHELKASLRHDDNSQFGGHRTGNLAWSAPLATALRAMLGYGEAFKAPTFNDLYWPGFGNANLRPERARSIEAGLDGGLPHGRWSLHAFRSEVRDLIAFDPVIFLPNNIQRARMRGLEGILSQRFGDWRADLNLTLLRPVQVGGVNDGKLLNRRAQRTARLDLFHDAGAWTAGLSLRGESRRYDDLANTVSLPGYGILDLTGEYRLGKDWRLRARVENLFDRAYETAHLYNQPGRGLFVSLDHRPR